MPPGVDTGCFLASPRGSRHYATQYSSLEGRKGLEGRKSALHLHGGYAETMNLRISQTIRRQHRF